MLKIDGKKGGGQMLRSALSMSVLKTEPFRIENIRGSRSNPGIKRQHLEAVKAAKKISSAEVSGLEEGSEQLVFRPKNLRPDPFTVNIGTAGATTLLLDTIIPITSQFEQPFRITAKGGTDVKWSPNFSYLKQVKLPLLRKFGFRGECRLDRTGYYPAGGGKTTLETEPYSLQSFKVEDRGELQRFEIYSKASKELEYRDVADRQAAEAARMLKNSHMSADIERNVKYVGTDSPGASLLLKAVYSNSVAGFDVLGEEGKRSEKVAEEAVQRFREFSSTEAAVDRYMADQLMIFLSLVGGSLKIHEVTQHVQTNLEVLRKFGADIELEEGRCTTLKA